MLCLVDGYRYGVRLWYWVRYLLDNFDRVRLLYGNWDVFLDGYFDFLLDGDRYGYFDGDGMGYLEFISEL